MMLLDETIGMGEGEENRVKKVGVGGMRVAR